MRLPSGRSEIREMVIGELGNVGRYDENSTAIHSRRPRRLHLHRRRRTQPGALQGRSCCTLPGDGRRSTTSRLRGKRRKSSSRYVRRSVLRQVMCSAALAMSGVTRVAPEKATLPARRRAECERDCGLRFTANLYSVTVLTGAFVTGFRGFFPRADPSA